MLVQLKIYKNWIDIQSMEGWFWMLALNICREQMNFDNHIDSKLTKYHLVAIK
jgi:hypothetical protein